MKPYTNNSSNKKCQTADIEPFVNGSTNVYGTLKMAAVDGFDKKSQLLFMKNLINATGTCNNISDLAKNRVKLIDCCRM